MPIEIEADIYRPTEDEFSRIAYDVMSCAFEIHNRIGRFFDEKIYKRFVAERYEQVQLEVLVKVVFGSFRKDYFLDMLVRNCALFEWKAAEYLAQEHRAQLLNYLFLCDLPRAKLINTRSEQVQHEFVNTSLQLENRRTFRVVTKDFRPIDNTDTMWQQFLVAAMRDWGSSLDIRLYEAAIAHALGREEILDVEIIVPGRILGRQKVKMTTSGLAYKVTSFCENESVYEQHIQRFLDHTNLFGIHWVNVTRPKVEFKTLLRKSRFGIPKQR